MWHGANYTFLIWGMINGGLLIIYHLQAKPRKKLLKKFGINNNSKVLIIAETSMTLFIIVLAWIFFRAETVEDAGAYIDRVFSKSLFTIPNVFFSGLQAVVSSSLLIALVIFYFVLEWKERNYKIDLSLPCLLYNRPLRWSVYFSLILLILFLSGDNQQFIYFQF